MTFGGRGRNRLQHRVDLGLGDLRDGHEVGRGLVAQAVRVLDHLHRFGDLVGVECDPDHVQHALAARHELLLPVALPRVRHGDELQVGRLVVVSADHPVQVFFVAVLPRAELLRGELPRRVLVADLHVVDAGGQARLVHGAHLLVAELMVVDQTPIANGAVEHLQFRSVGNPRGFVAHSRPFTPTWLR